MLQIAVIGLGNWGPKLVRCVQEMADCRLAALCDIDPIRLQAIPCGNRQVIKSADWKTVVENPAIDGVLIATPADLHFEIAHLALLNRKQVFVEKPLACASAQVATLQRAAERQGCVLMVDNTYLFAPAVLAIAQYLEGGALGTPLHYQSTRLNMYGERQDTDVLWDLAWHDLAIVDFLFPGRQWIPTRTRLGRYAARLDLYAAASPQVQINVDWTSNVKQRLVRIGCSRGEIIYDDLAVLKVQVDTKEGLFTPELSNEEPLKASLRHFLECVRDGRQPVAGAAMGLRIAKILEAADDSNICVGAQS